MNQETLDLLGFPQVVRMLQGLAQTTLGRGKLSQISPLTDPQAVRLRLRLIDETTRRRGLEGSVGLSHLEEPEAALDALSEVGSSMDPRELLSLLDLLRVGVRLRSELVSSRYPTLAGRWEPVADFGPLAREIERVIDPSGEILETADPELGAIRRRQKRAREKVQETLRRYLTGSASKFLIQEPFVTQRGNRYVIPVKVEHQRDLPGVVHGASSSGATLFTEPFPVVELNNECLFCQERELEIIARILGRLTARARQQREAIDDLADRVAEFDALQACAEFSARYRCVLPDEDGSGALELLDARHPLLLKSLSEERVVPISARIDPDKSVLIISGPNAGGKTVALKTIGLFALMAHAGLPVPAAQVRMPRFRQVLADIGDHQSIDQSLSTFSAHILRIRQMMENLQAPSLILLDEIGAGTDPDYGASLGIAILDFFRDGGALVVATTHHQAVKRFASSSQFVQNASVSLDPSTLRPTYSLTMGEAGESSALEIAAQLGLPASVTAAARELLDEKQVQVESYLARLRQESADLAAERSELKGVREALERRETARQIEFQEREAARRREAERALDTWEREFRRESERFVKSVGDRFEAARLRQEMKNKQAILQEAFRRKMAGGLSGQPDPAAGSATISDLKTGDLVYDSFFRKKGKVLELDGDNAILEVAGKRVSRPLAQLSRVESREVVRQPSRHVTLNIVENTDPELNLVGLSVEEALDRLDKFLDRAYLSELAEVRVIHGFGKGRLKDAVSDFLSGHRQVLSHRLEGGATVARLKS